MSGLQTLKLWLENDAHFPMFKRLRWQMVPVSLEDVLLKGIHPWVNGDSEYYVTKAIRERINSEQATIRELENGRYSYHIPDMNAERSGGSKLDTLLQFIHTHVYFTEGMGERQLIDVAQAHLRDQWCHSLARELAKCLHSGFQDLRQFLKEKNPKLKLSGYEDLEAYDLSKVLSVDDFQEHEHLLIEKALQCHNFRRASCIDQLTDDQGRLRLTREVKQFSLTLMARSLDATRIGTSLHYQVERTQDVLKFRPDLGDASLRKDAAAVIAERWRTDQGKLVFETSIGSAKKLLDEGARISFASLTYGSSASKASSHAKVKTRQMRTFVVGGYCGHNWRSDALKDVLSEHGIPLTGRKENLLDKVSDLGVKLYSEHLAELDLHFREHRLIRVAKPCTTAVMFPLLKELTAVGRLVIAAYVLRHLRGNAVLDPEHENNTYSVDQLINALVMGRVGLAGAFVEVG